MPKKITKLLFVFCEGPHDAEFISKILKIMNGYKDYSGKKLREYPSSLGTYYDKTIKSLDIIDRNKQSIFANISLPIILKATEECFILIHSMGGDKNWASAKATIENFLDLQRSQTLGQFSVNFALFYDSDSHGVLDREKRTRKQLVEIFAEEEEINAINCLKHNQSIKISSGTTLSMFVFTNENEDVGDLEGILLPLMSKNEDTKPNNDLIFQAAGDFINKFQDDNRVVGKFNKRKSIISIAGQLQLSGVNNTVIIRDSDYLSESKLKDNAHVKEISIFFDVIMELM